MNFKSRHVRSHGVLCKQGCLVQVIFFKLCQCLAFPLVAFLLALSAQNAFAQAEAAGGLLNNSQTAPPSGSNLGQASQYAVDAGSCMSASDLIKQDTLKAFSNSIDGPLSSLASSIQQTAVGLSANLTAIALTLGGGFALLTLLLDVALAMSRRQSVLEPIIPGLLLALTASFLVINYAKLVGFLDGIVKYITTKLSGTTDPFVEILKMFTGMLWSLVVMIGNVLNTACGWSGFFSHIGSVILVGVISLVTLFFILIALVEIIAVALLAPMMLGIGTTVGPVFVGLLASRWTQKWTLKWIEFILAAAILNLIVIVALTLLQNLFGTIGTLASNGAGAVMASLGLMVMSMALGKIFGALPGMASAMVPGHHGVSGGGASERGASQIATESKAAGGGAGGGAGVPRPASMMGTLGAGARVAAATLGGAAAVGGMRMAGAAATAVGLTAAGERVANAAAKSMGFSGGGATSTPPSDASAKPVEAPQSGSPSAE